MGSEIVDSDFEKVWCVEKEILEERERRKRG